MTVRLALLGADGKGNAYTETGESLPGTRGTAVVVGKIEQAGMAAPAPGGRGYGMAGEMGSSRPRQRKGLSLKPFTCLCGNPIFVKECHVRRC